MKSRNDIVSNKVLIAGVLGAIFILFILTVSAGEPLQQVRTTPIQG